MSNGIETIDRVLQRLSTFDTEKPRTQPRACRTHATRAGAADGWVCPQGELEEGLHAVAVPVFNAAGRRPVALSASGLSYHMSVERLSEIAKLYRRAACHQRPSRRKGPGELSRLLSMKAIAAPKGGIFAEEQS
jgi:DNA-binding IclR family transcriptional regulator